MRLWEFIKSEVEEFKEVIHRSPTADRTWDCEPLLVINDEHEVAFVGHANVDVHPYGDGTADLIAHENRDGWQPSLVRAKVRAEVFRTSTLGGVTLPSRGGLICMGADKDGNEFIWYINGSAERVAQRYLFPVTLPPETPVEE